jgi:hypothetical protein
MRAAYVPMIAIRKTVNIARDYSEWPKKSGGRNGETVDALDQKVELPKAQTVTTD